MARVERYVDGTLVGYEIDGVFVPLGADFVETTGQTVEFETVRPTISEGGRGAIMSDTHHVLMHKNPSMDLETFTLESSKRLTTKYISENGIYRAKDDDVYAWSKVSVNVFGGIGGGGTYVPTEEVDGVQVPAGDGSMAGETHYDGYVQQRGAGNEVTGRLDGGDRTVKCFNGSYINGLTAQSEEGRLVDVSDFIKRQKMEHHYILIDCSGSMTTDDKLSAVNSFLVADHTYSVWAYGDRGEERMVIDFTSDIDAVREAIRSCASISLGGYETYQSFLTARMYDPYLSITEVFTDEDPYQSYGNGPTTLELILSYQQRGCEIIVHALQ